MLQAIQKIKLCLNKNRVLSKNKGRFHRSKGGQLLTTILNQKASKMWGLLIEYLILRDSELDLF